MIIKTCKAVLLALLLMPLTATASPEFTFEVKSDGKLWITVTNPEIGGNYFAEIATDGGAYNAYTPVGQGQIGGKPIFVFATAPRNAQVRIVEKVNTAENGLVTNLSSPTLFVGLKAAQTGSTRTIMVEGPSDRAYTILEATQPQGPYVPIITGAVGVKTFVVSGTGNRFYIASHPR